MTMPMLRSLSLAVSIVVALTVGARADMQRGTYVYATLDQCRSAGKISEALCANAAANAEAEFDEKAPRFQTRRDCEARFGAGQCELGIKGASGWSGQKQGIFFMPRQSGFRITVRSESDATVVPSFRDTVQGFAPRSILRLQTSRSERFRREAGQSFAGRGGVAFGQPPGAGGGAFTGPVGPLPPPPPIDPNFDCASLLEPTPGQPASTGCSPVPASRLRR